MVGIRFEIEEFLCKGGRGGSEIDVRIVRMCGSENGL